MPAQTARKRNVYAHNGAYLFVMRGVQNSHTRVHRYACTDLQTLCCITYITGIDPLSGSGAVL